jgi:flagellar hook assembly protein FlgD
MYQNYPNPFNPSTRFRFDLPVDSRVRLYIYNTLGQEVARIVDGVDYAAGAQTVVWNGAGRDGQALPSGVYFYKLNAAPNGGQFQPFAKTGKMLLMK